MVPRSGGRTGDQQQQVVIRGHSRPHRFQNATGVVRDNVVDDRIASALRGQRRQHLSVDFEDCSRSDRVGRVFRPDDLVTGRNNQHARPPYNLDLQHAGREQCRLIDGPDALTRGKQDLAADDVFARFAHVLPRIDGLANFKVVACISVIFSTITTASIPSGNGSPVFTAMAAEPAASETGLSGSAPNVEAALTATPSTAEP